jgi:hypothetical protein
MLSWLAMHSVGQLVSPGGMCADDAVIIVSETGAHRISVFQCGDGGLLRRFGSESAGSGDGHGRALRWIYHSAMSLRFSVLLANVSNWWQATF